MFVLKNNKQVSDKSALFDNIVIVQEPNSHYLGFVSTQQSDAQSIYLKLLNFFIDNKKDLNHLFAIGSDGAATNVGTCNGIIKKFETFLKRPIHHIICLLHLLELILKAIICHLYSNIVRYKEVGRINEDINNCHNYPVVDFEKMELLNMPEMDVSFTSSVLNSDQKYLYEMGLAVSKGYVDDKLAACKLGNIVDPRWTILSSRFLRLYVATERPSLKLRSVVQFIQNVYIPMMFRIKHYPEWVNGSQHIFNMLMFSQCLEEKLFSLVKERIEYNGFFAHSENLLMCMICDDDIHVRRAACV